MTKPTVPSPSAGSDYVLVPREPTTKMFAAFIANTFSLPEEEIGKLPVGAFEAFCVDYKAMLTAAPAPVLVIELDQPRIPDGGQCNEQQPHAPSFQSHYSDEVTKEQIAAIEKLVASEFSDGEWIEIEKEAQ